MTADGGNFITSANNLGTLARAYRSAAKRNIVLEVEGNADGLQEVESLDLAIRIYGLIFAHAYTMFSITDESSRLPSNLDGSGAFIIPTADHAKAFVGVFDTVSASRRCVDSVLRCLEARASLEEGIESEEFNTHVETVLDTMDSLSPPIGATKLLELISMLEAETGSRFALDAALLKKVCKSFIKNFASAANDKGNVGPALKDGSGDLRQASSTIHNVRRVLEYSRSLNDVPIQKGWVMARQRYLRFSDDTKSMRDLGLLLMATANLIDDDPAPTPDREDTTDDSAFTQLLDRILRNCKIDTKDRSVKTSAVFSALLGSGSELDSAVSAYDQHWSEIGRYVLTLPSTSDASNAFSAESTGVRMASTPGRMFREMMMIKLCSVLTLEPSSWAKSTGVQFRTPALLVYRRVGSGESVSRVAAMIASSIKEGSISEGLSRMVLAYDDTDLKMTPRMAEAAVHEGEDS
jgi:hypothetical protein